MTIQVAKIGHASLLVMAGRMRCLMDPVLVQPFECGFNTFEPAVSLNLEKLDEQYNLVILSHEHMDHFCVQSLNTLNRQCPIIYPRGCTLIEHALSRLGFERQYQITPGQTLTFEDVTLSFTPSNVRFPEVGVLFEFLGTRFWNCVDCEIDNRAISMVVKNGIGPDLMFAQYQTLIEEELGVDALGASFPMEIYQGRLQAVLQAKPRCMVPSSCGYKYSSEEWLNQRGFPVTEQQFIDDVKLLEPEIKTRILGSGDTISADGFSIERDSLPFVSCIRVESVQTDWRPDQGVPPLRDDDPFEHGTEHLKNTLTHYLNTEFIRQLKRPELRAWQEMMREGCVAWQFDLIYPDRSKETRFIDFTYGVEWQTQGSATNNMVTAMSASTLYGLLNGEVTPYRAMFSRRVVLKLYRATPKGLMITGSIADEPVARATFGAANRLYIDAQLRQLGFQHAEEPAPITVGQRYVEYLSNNEACLN